jgi:hypothetical protein
VFPGFSKTYFDALASMGVGLVLVISAVLLANEGKGLLIGEGARPATLKTIRQMVEAGPAVEAAGRPLTVYLGPETVLLALDILFRRGSGRTQMGTWRVERKSFVITEFATQKTSKGGISKWLFSVPVVIAGNAKV